MTEEDAKLLLWAEAAVACLLIGSVWFVPGAMGPLQLMAAHPALAPWFSGTATMLGVFAALYNTDRQLQRALARQEFEDQRKAADAENAERSRKTSAAQLVGLVMFAANASRLARKGETPHFAWKSEQQLYRRLLRRLEAFPINDIDNDAAVSAWHRIESGVSIIGEHYNEGVARFAALQTVDQVSACPLMAVQNQAILDMLELVERNCSLFWSKLGVPGYTVVQGGAQS